MANPVFGFQEIADEALRLVLALERLRSASAGKHRSVDSQKCGESENPGAGRDNEKRHSEFRRERHRDACDERGDDTEIGELHSLRGDQCASAVSKGRAGHHRERHYADRADRPDMHASGVGNPLWPQGVGARGDEAERRQKEAGVKHEARELFARAQQA